MPQFIPSSILPQWPSSQIPSRDAKNIDALVQKLPASTMVLHDYAAEVLIGREDPADSLTVAAEMTRHNANGLALYVNVCFPPARNEGLFYTYNHEFPKDAAPSLRFMRAYTFLVSSVRMYTS
ncbi:hypothetical protein PAAG_02341 [Paracoccidioides lutzii Pb01]|uniref:Uncharacterized protein n=1 Tax=Paracoccidioides lutzii (strain ATCC MYA-826 / Pb01) TaxID=502779 RepID=C1GUL8_PARBA|nr:hypothetical protein PAAG_02341 [Paracoccidioides lutzii Pb01]EEH40286.2 hypothetical protein PAAG_02341 [Paracoccidioides lutzii Pb01]